MTQPRRRAPDPRLPENTPEGLPLVRDFEFEHEFAPVFREPAPLTDEQETGQ